MQVLELAKRAGQIVDYRYEPFALKLAKLTTYTPDFLVIYSDRFELHEVKGFWQDDARVKIKVAAERFPWFRFLAIQKETQKNVRLGKPEWKFEEFGL